VIAMLSLLFSACEKCKLANTHSLNISWAQPVVHNNGAWIGSETEIINGIAGSLRSNFDQPEQLTLVQSAAEYYVTIDSVFCTSTQSTETVSDPCWKSQGFLLDQLFPQPKHAYTLRGTSVSICFTIKDTLHHFEEAFTVGGSSSEYLYLPPADSTNCYPYELKGNSGPWNSVDIATDNAYRSFKCIINKWLHGRL
jgi:hypothetical protein